MLRVEPAMAGQFSEWSDAMGASAEGYSSPGDVSRKKLPHLGFAFGLHSCLGMNLARLEAQIFLEEPIDALPEWTIAEPLDYGTNYTVRGPTAVRVSAA